jgi:hypothetical protein
MGFNNTDQTERALSVSLFFLFNKRVLSSVSGSYAQRLQIRTIYFYPEHSIQNPNVSPTAKLVISTLIALQMLGFAFPTIFTYHTLTWTHNLNAMAMVVIGNTFDPEFIPPVGAVNKDPREKLESVSGVVEVKSPQVPQQLYPGSQLQLTPVNLLHAGVLGNNSSINPTIIMPRSP